MELAITFLAGILGVGIPLCIIAKTHEWVDKLNAGQSVLFIISMIGLGNLLFWSIMFYIL